MCSAVASVTAHRLLIISKSADHNTVFSCFLSKTRRLPQPCLPLRGLVSLAGLKRVMFQPAAVFIPWWLPTQLEGNVALDAWRSRRWSWWPKVLCSLGGLCTRLHTQHTRSLSPPSLRARATHTKHTQTLLDNHWWSCCKQGKLI